MREIKISFTIQVYENFDSFTEVEKTMLKKAIQARRNAYARYSKFRVGSAVLMKNGMKIPGSNQENAVLPIGICAERVALGYASHNYPDVPVVALALSTEKDPCEDELPVFPCGSCRQAIAEQESKFGSKIKLFIMGNNNKTYVIDSVSDILPFAFTGKLLE